MNRCGHLCALCFFVAKKFSDWKLPEGVVVKVLDEKLPWYAVRVGDRVGWMQGVPASQLAAILTVRVYCIPDAEFYFRLKAKRALLLGSSEADPRNFLSATLILRRLVGLGLRGVGL